MNKKPVMRAVFYRKHKTKSGNKQSLENDLHEKYVIQKLPNCTLTEVYEETNNSKKPVLKKLLKDCEQGNIDVIVMDNMDDLSSSPTEVNRIFHFLGGLEHQVGVYFFYENIYSLSDDALLCVEFTALIEEHQREINNRRKEERKEFALLKKQSGK